MHFAIQSRFKQACLISAIAVFICSLGVASTAAANALDNLKTSSQTASIAHLVNLKQKGINSSQKSVTTKTQSGNLETTIADINQSLINNSSRIGFAPKKTPAPISRQQQSALSLLSKTTNTGGWQARFNSQSGAVATLRSALHQTTGISRIYEDQGPLDALARAKRFIQKNAALLNLKQYNDSLSLKSQSLDANNASRHLRFKQLINDIPVWGKELLVHLNANGEIYQINGDYLPDGPIPNPVASLFDNDAIEATKAHLNVNALDKPTAELVYYSSESQAPVLAWKVDARPKLNQWYHYFIDAKDGHVIHRINNLHTSVEQASGLDLNGQQVNFNSWLSNEIYFMVDPTFPINDVTPQYDPINNSNAKGDTIVVDAGNQASFDDLSYVFSRTANSNWDSTAVTVMNNTRIIYDYYLENFGRKSLDDDNMNLVSVIHYDQDWAQAAWNGQAMIYGDGDGKVFNSLAKCFDVAAHEMTHGVITHTANLIYENQSGALNESFADIFAALMDSDDWTLGEDCTVASPGYIRNLADPSNALTKQPSNFSDYVNLPNTESGDNGGVHINSGIPNHAFYLTAKALGHQSTGKIYYRALNTYLTASSQFIDAREALEQSAIDLYGSNSNELTVVSDAWDNVGVSEATTGPSGSTRPTVTDPVIGDDLMVYLTPQGGNSTSFDVYRQTLPEVFENYDAETDVGPLNANPARFARPTVITASNGTFITYVSEDNNLYVINPGSDSLNSLMIGNNSIWTATFSPDGRYAAYTTSLLEDNQIHIVDLKLAKSYDYPIVLPSYQEEEESSASVKVRFADSLSFDYTSEKLIFDVLLCASLPNDDCNESQNSGYNYWGVGILDVANGGKFNFPFPSQSPLFSLGYPVFANNNNFVSILDVSYYNSDTELFESGAYTYNYETQTLSSVFALEAAKQTYYTSPNFWGDDNFATFAYPDLDAGRFVAARVAVSEGSNWQGADSAIRINPNYTLTPVMHRAGVRVVNRDLSISSNSLDFGTANEGESRQLSLTLTNNGNSDVDVTSVTSSGENFSHNATNKRLPRGESTVILVSFTPGNLKNYAGTLVINSTGTPNTISISLNGLNPNGTNPSSGGGSSWLLLVLMALGVFRKKSNSIVGRHY